MLHLCAFSVCFFMFWHNYAIPSWELKSNLPLLIPDFMVMMKTCRPPSLLENVIVYKAYSKLWCIFYLHVISGSFWKTITPASTGRTQHGWRHHILRIMQCPLYTRISSRIRLAYKSDQYSGSRKEAAWSGVWKVIIRVVQNQDIYICIS